MFAVPQFRVEQTVEPMPSVTLDEVQARVCKCIEAHPDFWCEEEDRGAELPPLLSKVRATKSIRAIHEALGLDTFEAY